MTLSYLRHHSTFQFLGVNFGISESTAHNIFHYWLKILSVFLPPSLLEQFKDEDKYEEFLNDLSEVELIVDTSEQSRQRTMDKAEREKCYSGYKHNHTVKKIITLPKAKDIIAVSIGGYGTKADITIFREIQLQFKSEQKFKKDKVFVEGNNISTLHKKSKKKELAEQKNEENKIFSEKSFC